jgi:hypothetical protein
VAITDDNIIAGRGLLTGVVDAGTAKWLGEYFSTWDDLRFGMQKGAVISEITVA